MKNIAKTMFLSLLILMLISINVSAYDLPPILVFEDEPTTIQPFIVTGVDFTDSATTKGDYVDARVKLKFNHDCEKYEVSFAFFTSEMNLGSTGTLHKQVKYIPHKTGDEVYVAFVNLPTSSIPDSYCHHNIGGFSSHRLYYDGSYHMTTNQYSSNTFLLNCQSTPPACEEKPLGDKYCSGYDVVRRWQYQDCSVHVLPVTHCYPSTCQYGVCVEPCSMGAIGSNFCKNNAVYQKYGLGRLGGVDCKFEDRLQTQCEFNEACDGGNCVATEYCGDGVCNHLETYNTCSGDCPKSWSCGDGDCNREDEDEESCPQDCELPEILCPNGVCDSGETHDTCPADCPRIWLWILLILGLTGTGIYFIVKRVK